ncbi:protein ABHD13-like [Penaeus chinensis]|uniref:protein ABHD13-like n=1 Tax=Penaeus chinensis TaxID=139456 RepID=UPI001FB82F4F|nr:protein ABHD13-like [Penaeus chinensis]
MASSDVESGQPCLPPNPPPRPRACLHHQHHQHHHHHHNHDCEEEMTPKQKADFAVIKFVAGLVLIVMRKFWFTSAAVMLGIFVLFWLYGGCLALLLTLIAFSGIYTVHLYIASNLRRLEKSHIWLQNYFVTRDPLTMSTSCRLSNVYEMYRWLHVNLLLLEYRGYGLSEGSPSEEGLYLDAQAAINYLKTRSDIDQNKIIIFGRSLGGAVAVDCVSRSEISSRVAAVILENTFTSIPDMAKVLFSNVKFLAKLPEWCHKNKYLSKYKMCRVVVPTLFLSGQADSLVPPRMMMELYHCCASPAKRLMQFTQGSHNETWKCPGYYQVLLHFLDELFQRTTQPPVLLPGVVCFSEPQIL